MYITPERLADELLSTPEELEAMKKDLQKIFCQSVKEDWHKHKVVMAINDLPYQTSVKLWAMFSFSQALHLMNG